MTKLEADFATSTGYIDDTTTGAEVLRTEFFKQPLDKNRCTAALAAFIGLSDRVTLKRTAEPFSFTSSVKCLSRGRKIGFARVNERTPSPVASGGADPVFACSQCGSTTCQCGSSSLDNPQS